MFIKITKKITDRLKALSTGLRIFYPCLIWIIESFRLLGVRLKDLYCSSLIPYLSYKFRLSTNHSSQVRGAPAIAIVGCLSLAAELPGATFSDAEEVASAVAKKLKYLVTARPTTVNMETAAKELTAHTEKLKKEGSTVEKMVEGWVTCACMTI